MQENENFLYPLCLQAEIRRKITLFGSSEYGVDLDSWFFFLENAKTLDKTDIASFEVVPDKIKEILKRECRLAYWSGGFDLGFNHFQLLCALPYIIPKGIDIVLGIEPDSYIRYKGREPIFPAITRLSATATILKTLGILGFAFIVPERPEETPTDLFYEQIVRAMGINRKPGCYHLYSYGDPNTAQKRNRMLDPKPWCELPMLGKTKPLSVTEVLRMPE